MNTLLKHTLILATFSLIATAGGHAQSQSLQLANDKVLTGHEKKNEDAIRDSTDVVIGVFTSLGYPGPDADGEDDYDQAEIEIVSSLKGTLSGKLKVFYIVYSMPGKKQENPPALGAQYIMFVKELGPKEHRIKKLLLATDDNIAKIKALIAAAPLSK